MCFHFPLVFLQYYSSQVIDDSKHSRRQKHPSARSHPSQSEKDEMTDSLNRILPKLVQPSLVEPLLTTIAPLTSGTGATAPLYNASSISAASLPVVSPNVKYPGQDDVSSDRFSNPGMRVNSTQVDDTEQAARAEYLYQKGIHRSNPAPGWPGPYSAPYSDSGAFYGHGYYARIRCLRHWNLSLIALEINYSRFKRRVS
jgi:hypothetical protein